MYITVQFKNKEMDFGGRTYDFEVVTGNVPKKGDIIRMYSPDGREKVCHATRVKVVDVKNSSEKSERSISCVASSMDEPSISKRR